MKGHTPLTQELEAALTGAPASLLRIFVGSHDRYQGGPLFDAIVKSAREAGLAGATVFEGFMGYGANSLVHHASVWRLSEDLPIVIELIDQPAKVEAFLPKLEAMLSGGGLITLETVHVLSYQPDAIPDPPEEEGKS